MSKGVATESASASKAARGVRKLYREREGGIRNALAEVVGVGKLDTGHLAAGHHV